MTDTEPAPDHREKLRRILVSTVRWDWMPITDEWADALLDRMLEELDPDLLTAEHCRTRHTNKLALGQRADAYHRALHEIATAPIHVGSTYLKFTARDVLEQHP